MITVNAISSAPPTMASRTNLTKADQRRCMGHIVPSPGAGLSARRLDANGPCKLVEVLPDAIVDLEMRRRRGAARGFVLARILDAIEPRRGGRGLQVLDKRFHLGALPRQAQVEFGV